MLRLLACLALAASVSSAAPAPDPPLVLGGNGRHCGEDPHCTNRLHPGIPMVARAAPGRTIVMHTYNAGDEVLDAADANGAPDPRPSGPPASRVHPIIGPVHIEGARPGDVLAVTLLAIEPGPRGYTFITGSGWVTDAVPGPYRIDWKLTRDGATSDALPGVRIPDASFPGIVTVVPGPDETARILAREAELLEAGGRGWPPEPANALPVSTCGTDGPHAAHCLRTLPPREHGGNLDIRYIGRGATVYLPCRVDGCGLAIGDLHFAQGDGEVAGTAIEMDATVTLTTRLIRDDPRSFERGPHFEGPARLLDIPSRTFYATTGFPFKARGEGAPWSSHLDTEAVRRLTNLDRDLGLAARNALLAMIDHLVATYGLTPQQAYAVCSVAVDLRIGQVVDAPNVGVTAILPTDVFVAGPAPGN